jgi:hypothetical protein
MAASAKDPINNLQCLAEKKFVDLGKHAILSMHMVGYLPLRVSRDLRSLEIKLLSIPGLLPYITLLISISHGICTVLNHDVYIDAQTVTTETERLTVFAIWFCSTLVNIIFKIWGLCTKKSTAEFWKQNSALFQDLLSQGMDIDHQKFKKSLRSVFLFNQILVFGFLIGVASLYFIPPSAVDYDFYGESRGEFRTVLALLGRTLMLLQHYMHAGHATWFIFFIRFYKDSFTLIQDNLAKLSLEERSQAFRDLRVLQQFQLFNKVETRVEAFNVFFGTKLILEVVNSIVICIIYSFFGILQTQRRNYAVIIGILLPALVIMKNFYHLTTDSSQLTASTRRILTQLFAIIQADDELISRRVRQKVHIEFYQM